jgi:hypothetical protein
MKLTERYLSIIHPIHTCQVLLTWRNEKNFLNKKNKKTTNCKEFENHPSNKNSAWQSFYDAKVSSSTPNKTWVPQTFDSYMRGREPVSE